MSEIPPQTAEEVPRKPLGKTVIAILLVVIAVSAVGLLWWYTQHFPSSAPQYKTYSKYGFSFQHPKDMTMSEYGLLESTATENSGMILGDLKNDKHELVTVNWLKSETAPDLESFLEDAFNVMAKEEGVTSLEKVHLVETTKAGHRMLYQYSIITMGGEQFFGMYGVWYCDISQRIYSYSYTLQSPPGLTYSEEDILPVFQRYVDSFVCH